MTKLRRPEIFHISDGATTFFAGHQDWYDLLWHQRAGCGPTTASNIVWYLSQTREELRALWPFDARHKDGFVRLMDALWEYVTPGKKGVNTTKIFTDGIMRYARDRGASVRCDVMEISSRSAKRPEMEQVIRFVTDALAEDVPVAFLNLSNGELDNLDSWHWVTLVSVESETGCAGMADQGKEDLIDLQKWLKTTALGGGFVAVYEDLSRETAK